LFQQRILADQDYGNAIFCWRTVGNCIANFKEKSNFGKIISEAQNSFYLGMENGFSSKLIVI
jgi:hypothetical protein